MRGKFCSGTKILRTIISTTIVDVEGIKLKTSRVKSLVVIRRFVGEIAQYGECKNCQSTNCDSQSNEWEEDVINSAETNNNNSKDKSENWGRE
jgi:hypothetical protein